MRNFERKNNSLKFLQVRSHNKGLELIIFDIMVEKIIDNLINENLSKEKSTNFAN